VPTFEAVIYTGGQLEIANWDSPVVIDLAGLGRGNVLVANLDHDPKKRVGNFDVENDGRTLRARGVASAATPARDEVVNSARAGYIWQASVEVQPDKVQSVPDGDEVQVNGQSLTGPLYITRRGTLKGFAFVSHGADDNTHVSIAARRRQKMGDFQAWAKECGLDTSLMTAAEMAKLRANYHGRTEPIDEDHAAVAPMIHASADPVQAEQHRLRQIEAACKGTWHDDAAGRVNELRAQAVGGNLSVDELLSQLREIRMQETLKQFGDPPPRWRGRHDADAQLIEAAFALTGGLSSVEKLYAPEILDAADKMRNSVSLQPLILSEACRHGYSARPGERITQGNIRAVLAAAFTPIHASTGWTTTSLTNTLSNVSNKFLRDGWMAVDQTALRIAAVRPVQNFKEIKTVSLLGGSLFEQLGKGGEIPHGELGEETYTNKADTYGLMFAITREDIINDDLDALTAVPRRLGRSGMLKLNDLVWRIFLNNGSFFTSGRGNLITDDLDMDGLAVAETAFINQTDPDGNPLGIMPAILLVPPTKRATALQLMNSQLVVTGTGGAMPNANVWQGRFRVESSPYMENAGYTGFSSEAWYLLADPAQMPVIEIAALNGRVEPTVETAEASFNVLGIQMRGWSDIGVALQEYRGGVRSDGSEEAT
jgi:hypothetical protein